MVLRNHILNENINVIICKFRAYSINYECKTPTKPGFNIFLDHYEATKIEKVNVHLPPKPCLLFTCAKLAGRQESVVLRESFLEVLSHWHEIASAQPIGIMVTFVFTATTSSTAVPPRSFPAWLVAIKGFFALVCYLRLSFCGLPLCPRAVVPSFSRALVCSCRRALVQSCPRD